jgi:hypothetical protein
MRDAPCLLHDSTDACPGRKGRHISSVIPAKTGNPSIHIVLSDGGCRLSPA